jgi:hypothetical protein
MIKILDIEFKSKKEAINYIREIWDKNPLRKSLINHDFEFMKAVFYRMSIPLYVL